VVSHLASEFLSIGCKEYINWFAKAGFVAMGSRLFRVARMVVLMYARLFSMEELTHG